MTTVKEVNFLVTRCRSRVTRLLLIVNMMKTMVKENETDEKYENL